MGLLTPLLYFLLGAIFCGLLVYFRMHSKVREAQLQFSFAEQNRLALEGHHQKTELLQQKNEQQMVQQFENLAHKIFEEKSQKFDERHLRGLAGILDPVKERLKDFERKVEETYSSERTDRGMLRGELNKLMDLNKQMAQDASNLTRALKGENKTQGNWGELILENILERSGLRKGEEYILQGTNLDLKNAEGSILRPDVIILLPDNKHLIVDSKMTLNAYEEYVNGESLELQEKWARQHVESLKRHIDGLSDKKYDLADKLISPDFVMLFMPIEPAFSLAFRIKPDLFQYAWDKGIAIVSPTTLLSTLRTVAALWKHDRQERNALEIARRGGLLYEKFFGVLKDLEVLGEKLGAAQKAHFDLTKKISEGRGNLLDQVEELKRLGAKTEKSLTKS